MRRRTFVVHSPKLAGRLFYAGYKMRETVNPFNPEHRILWEIELDKGSAKIIKQFYEEIQKSVPSVIEKLADDQDPEGMDE